MQLPSMLPFAQGTKIMLKIVFSICCGIDVHKKFVVATVGATNESCVTDYQTRAGVTPQNNESAGKKKSVVFHELEFISRERNIT